VSKQEYAIRLQNCVADLVEERKVHRCSLSSHISIVTVAEMLMAAPQAMRLQRGCVDVISLQPPQACTTVIDVNH
jgi:hypothetical protein